MFDDEESDSKTYGLWWGSKKDETAIQIHSNTRKQYNEINKENCNLRHFKTTRILSCWIFISYYCKIKDVSSGNVDVKFNLGYVTTNPVSYMLESVCEFPTTID